MPIFGHPRLSGIVKLPPCWVPDWIELPGTLAGRTEIEQVFHGDIRSGLQAALVFPVSWLECPAPGGPKAGKEASVLPRETDFPEVVRLMIGLERDASRFGVAAVAARMGMTSRTLQRRLSRSDHTFSALSEEVERATAEDLLGRSGLSVTDTAMRRGYCDVAHFSRAFRRWTGVSPSRWRQKGNGVSHQE